MYPSLRLFVSGEWRSDGREQIAVVNPMDETTLGGVPVATPVDLDDALEAARFGFAKWRSVPVAERARILHAGAALLRQRAPTIARIASAELGCPLSAAVMEVTVASDVLDWSAGEARRIYGREIPTRFPGTRQLALKEPIGPVFAVAPWNMPAIFPARKISEALAAGCSIIIKPSEETPATAMCIVECLEEAGVPPGVINLVFGIPDMISRHLLASPVIRKLSFTGSVPVGRHLATLAAERLIKATMELGGHAPAIVFDDVAVEPVARMLAERKARNAGQVCNSPTRFYVHERIYSAFTEAFAGALKSIRIGDPADPATQMGPLVSLKRLNAIEDLVTDARDRGARVVVGGSRIGNRGFFHELTLLDAVPDDARVMTEEPFGPIAAMQPFTSTEDVIARANGLPFGLAAYAFSASQRKLQDVTAALEVGLLGLNHCNIAAAETPFGGVKESGYGSEGGSEGIEGYLVTKFVSEAAEG
jgi:succinate-semialdehyde dehydrogenase / glutarate-semialdehyde dehydrogenase